MNNPLDTKTTETTVINRREIEPLQIKASEVMEYYERAVGCETSVLDTSGRLVNGSKAKSSSPFCELCREKYADFSRDWEEDEYPCTVMHSKAQSKAQSKGSYIYTCEIGISYWTSPLYAKGRYAGSLVAGQILTVPREEVANQFYSRYGVSRKKVLELLSVVPEKSHEEIIALARLLLICAEQLSSDPGDKSSAMGDVSFMETPLSMKLAENYPIERKIHQSYPVISWTYAKDNEQLLLAALRRGDKKTASKIIDELLDFTQKNGSGDFDCVRLFSIELAVLLSRAEGGKLDQEDEYYRYLMRLQESRTLAELRENLHVLIDHIGLRLFSFRGLRHASALRKAERFIWENYTRKISLKEIADASGLSASYFSTIFKEEMGKNLSTYLNQLRIEKAAAYLTGTSLSLNKIAKSCGFLDQSWFSKIFKIHMGRSPARYREQGNSISEDQKK